jgi:hypothetical protein
MNVLEIARGLWEKGRPQTCGQADVSRVANQARCVRREVRNLTVMGMDPKQPPDQAELIKDLEQSARVEMRLRSMALAHAKVTQRSHGRQRCNSATRLPRSPLVR